MRDRKRERERERETRKIESLIGDKGTSIYHVTKTVGGVIFM